jgi:hypothetical protein
MDTRCWAAIALLALVGCATPRAAGTPAPAPAPTSEGAVEAIYQSFAPDQVDRIAAVRPYVEAAARSYDLEPELVYGVIWVESRFQPDARSPAGARGLMQLMPQTAAALAKELGTPRPRSLDPEFNVTAGSYYLRRLLDRYHGDEELALAAYHAGAGNVNRWIDAGQGLPEFSRKYVGAVFEARARFRGTPIAEPSPIAGATVPPRREPPRLPAARTPEAPPPGDEPTFEEPVFVPRPELDMAATRASDKPPASPRLEQAPAPAAPPAPDPDVGVGLLPGVLE